MASLSLCRRTVRAVGARTCCEMAGNAMLRNNIPDGTTPERFVSPKEFSELSGLSMATIHRYIKNGKLPSRQPAGPRGRILIPAEALAIAPIIDTPMEQEQATNTTLQPHPQTTVQFPSVRPAPQVDSTGQPDSDQGGVNLLGLPSVEKNVSSAATLSGCSASGVPSITRTDADRRSNRPALAAIRWVPATTTKLLRPSSASIWSKQSSLDWPTVRC